MSILTNKGKRLTFGGASISYVPFNFVPEFQAVYDRWDVMGTVPNYDDALVWDTMVRSMVNSGEWANLDRWFYFAVHTNDNGEALIDWVDPSRTSVAINNPTFTAYEGFSGDASTSYISLEYTTFVDSINYQIQDASACIYVRPKGTYTGYQYLLGGLPINRGTSLSFFNPTRILWGVNALFRSYIDLSLSYEGFWTLESSNIDTQMHKNSVLLDSYGVTTSSTSSVIINALSNHNGTLFSDKQISMVSIGANVLNRNNIQNYIETSMTTFGKGVIN